MPRKANKNKREGNRRDKDSVRKRRYLSEKAKKKRNRKGKYGDY